MRTGRFVGFFLLAIALAMLAAPAAQAQPFGGWLELNGTSGYIEVPANPVLNPTTGFTFEAWVRITDPHGCSSIAGKNYTQAWWVGVCDTTLRSYLHGSSSGEDGGTIPAGVWTHVAVTWNGAFRRHYINGTQVDATADAVAPTTSASAFRIGSDVPWEYTPAGSIDEVNLWNVARTQAQIQADLAGPITGPVQGLLAVWSFNGNGRDGVAVYNGVPVGAVDFGAPGPPGGAWLTTSELSGFRFKVRIAGTTTGVQESDCLGETLCVSGAVPGRSEAFVRIVGPRPNGYLWPNVVKFTTSTVEVWIEQLGTGSVKYYALAGAWPGLDDLPGLYDRTGFLP
jgi:hypothetical protein